MLLRITYVSKAATPMDPPALAALLEECQAGNQVHGITGLLCSGRGHFVQLIEGPQDNVVALYAAILRDKRHQQSVLLETELTGERVFAGWHMGHVDGDALSEETHARLVGFKRVQRALGEPSLLLRSALSVLRGDSAPDNNSEIFRRIGN